jgi:DNA repair protein RecN (Recombination protein N)
MLEHLRVVNLGVIAEAVIDPAEGLTVVTGETGAGKTMLLGGLRLVLGAQADAQAVGPYGDTAQVDGFFSDGDAEIGASRIVPADGRSRAYLEGSIVSAATLADRLGAMVEIVGQHDQLSLTRPSHVLEVIDGSLDDDGLAALDDYRRAWERLQSALDRQRQLGGDQVELARELDLARYQASEIEAAGLSEGLDDDLESQVSRLRNSEEITEHLMETLALAEQMSEAVGEMVARLRKASGLDTSLAKLAGDADGLAGAIAEVARESRVSAETVESDPTRLTEMEDRLTAIGDLKRKYGRALTDVISYGAATKARVEELTSLIADADRIDGLVASARAEVVTRADALTAARVRAGESIAAAMAGHLADLGIPKARVVFEPTHIEPGASGADHVEMQFASDDRLQVRPVGDGASGGELSRLVLALRLATRSDVGATLVFDEIDTGIGGKTALAMGEKLGALARDGQVLCVTHLPQVAAHADAHYVVERGEDGVASTRLVTGDDRVVEISRMLAGRPESEAGQIAAVELLAKAGK